MKLSTAWWVRDSRLLPSFEVRDVPSLKSLFALAVLAGSWRETRPRPPSGAPPSGLEDWFPASLDDLTTEAHLARNDAALAVRALADRHLVERRYDLWRTFERGRGIAAYRFVQPAEARGFFPFPYARVSESGFLGSIRSTPAAAAALKCFLVVGTFRENRSGLSMVSYDKFVQYGGMERRNIRRGLSLLIQHRLVDVFAPAERGAAPTRYFIQGLMRTPPMNANVGRVVSEKDLPF